MYEHYCKECGYIWFDHIWESYCPICGGDGITVFVD
jgi:rubrerythrin